MSGRDFVSEVSISYEKVIQGFVITTTRVRADKETPEGKMRYLLSFDGIQEELIITRCTPVETIGDGLCDTCRPRITQLLQSMYKLGNLNRTQREVFWIPDPRL